jgi:2-aminoadipate transaminase
VIKLVNYARRMKNMESTANIIRGLFGAMSNPDIISFGGGAVAREALPVEQIRKITFDLLDPAGRGVEVLSYGPVQGVPQLRQAVVDNLLKPKGVDAKMEDIIILTGGLEAMNLLCQVFIDPGDVILVETPTFVHSVETFDMFEAKLVPVRTDENGMDPDDVEAKIKEFNPKMVYVVPTFQNPTGITLNLERRKRLAELGSKYDVLILEDDPYRDIRYSGVDLPPIKSFDKTGNTVLANSFSKIFSPGMRLGYLYASPEIISKTADAKSATNSHTSMLPQLACAEFFRMGYYDDHMKSLCSIHKERRDAMLKAIDTHFPEGTKRTNPDGGLFIWVELPGEINTTELLREASSNPEIGVAYIAGEGFFTEGGGKGTNCMRLCFSGVPVEKINIGIERLGKLIRSKMVD